MKIAWRCVRAGKTSERAERDGCFPVVEKRHRLAGHSVTQVSAFPEKPMKKLISLLALAAFAVVSQAADTKPVETTFQRYWSSYAKKDFAKAAADVSPSDLEATKAAVLPVFLAGQGSTAKDAAEVLSAFFGKTVGKARETMSAVDVFVGLNRVVAAGSPELFEVLKDAAVSIIFVRSVSEDAAEIHFQVMVRGQGDTDAESLVKKDGRWWVKIKDDPKQTADSFKELFAGK
jgi:hypothetical protein